LVDKYRRTSSGIFCPQVADLATLFGNYLEILLYFFFHFLFDSMGQICHLGAISATWVLLAIFTDIFFLY